MDDAAHLSAVTTWLDSALNREQSGDFTGLELAPMRAVLAHLPTPPPPVTIAGTKGKGSTQRLIETGLLAVGMPTLAFTSPHVRRVSERWRVDGEDAPAAALAEAARVAAAAEVAAGVRLSWFERSFAMAVALAATRPQAAFLVEVGIGGRLDATNALDAAVAVVTHLSHDHRDVLGPTLEHIAREKLGIARADRPLIIAPQRPDAALAIARRRTAGDAAGALLHQVECQKSWDLALRGAHQQETAATAAAVLDVLVPGWDRQAVARAWATTTLPARCQVVEAGGRRLLIDGAHNGPSVAATLAVAQTELPPGFTVVLALARDKEVDEVLAALPNGISVVRCGYDSPRSRDEASWPPAARAWPWHADVREALARNPGPLCITGSFYVAAEALAALDVG
jgi:dihydrofolate synthase/folylpolyglutamate synthase